MPKVDLLDRTGAKLGDRDLPAELFEATVNVPLMHQVVVAGLAALRAGTHSTKTRAEVRGGGRKPWRQKGTGRARQGSIRAPHFTGGGIAHGPKPRNYEMRVNKKMKRAALRGALTDSLRSGKLALLDDLSFDEPKTSAAIEVIQALVLAGKILLVLPAPEEITEKSFRNLPYVKVTYAPSLSVYDLLAADRVVFTRAAMDVLEGKDPAATEGGPAAGSAASGREAGPASEEPRRRSTPATSGQSTNARAQAAEDTGADTEDDEAGEES